MIRNSFRSLMHKMRFIVSRTKSISKYMVISLVILAFSTACTQRIHIDRKYSDSFRAVFAVQGQASSKNVSPLTADDAKNILDRRDDKGSRGKSKSRTKRNAKEAKDILSIL